MVMNMSYEETPGKAQELRHQANEVQRILRQSVPSRPDKMNAERLASLRWVDEALTTLINQFTEEFITLEQLRSLVQTWGLINSSLDLQTVLHQSLDQVIALTGAERGYILWRSAGGEENFRIAHSVEQASDDDEFQISYTIVNQVIESGQPLLTDNAVEDDNINQARSVMIYAMRSVLCVPLKQKSGRVFGAVYVANRSTAGLFSPRELDLLTVFADQASIAIENAREHTIVKTELAKANQEVERLRIKVNKSQLDRQVSEVTDSEFFRDLQARASDLRGRKSDET
jgi:GAF domain-containing protein